MPTSVAHHLPHLTSMQTHWHRTEMESYSFPICLSFGTLLALTQLLFVSLQWLFLNRQGRFQNKQRSIKSVSKYNYQVTMSQINSKINQNQLTSLECKKKCFIEFWYHTSNNNQPQITCSNENPIFIVIIKEMTIMVFQWIW